MILKQYIRQIEANIKPDTNHPKEVVQLLACLIGDRLSRGGKLPVSCGSGEHLDMDIINEGIFKGLEMLSKFDATQGSLRQFLYPSMAGAMRNYAWERENRVGDMRSNDLPKAVSFFEKASPQDSDHYSDGKDIPEEEIMPQHGDMDLLDGRLVDPQTASSPMEAEEEEARRAEVLGSTIRHLGRESMGMLLRDAQIGYNSAERQKWADSLGVSVGALSVKLSRLRRDAREWAMNVQ